MIVVFIHLQVLMKTKMKNQFY